LPETAAAHDERPIAGHPDEAAPRADAALRRLPGYALRRASHHMMGELAQRLEEADLRIPDATVLLLVAGRNDLTSSDIGRTLDIQRANMVPLLARIEAAGLIRRMPLDRKSLAIVLTDAGAERLVRVQAIIARFEADLMARIPAAHRPHFVPALHALLG